AHAIVAVPPLLRTEQRASVATVKSVKDVAAFVVGAERDEEAVRANALFGGLHEALLRVVQAGHSGNGEVRTFCGDEFVALTLHESANGHASGERAEPPHEVGADGCVERVRGAGETRKLARAAFGEALGLDSL